MLPCASRRSACMALAACWIAASAPAAHAQAAHGDSGLRTPTDLARDLARSLADRKPLLVLVSLDRCPFCRAVRDSHLRPLQVETGQMIVQLDMKSHQLVADFAGQVVTHDQLIRRWGIRVAPTVLFFGRSGVEVAPRLDGAYLPDFYGAYLEDRLQIAQRSVGR